MINWTFVRRQLTTARQQSLIFVLCVALALITLVGVNSFANSVNQALLSDAKELHAGDIIIHSNQLPSDDLVTELQNIATERAVRYTTTREFMTVARVLSNDNSLLTELKVVEPEYPFYGEVELETGRSLDQVLKAGAVIAEQLVLDRLNLDIGDKIRLGDATLRIDDVLIRDPASPVNFFAFGPRIFVAAIDLDSLNLVKPGSRVHYHTLLQVEDQSSLNAVALRLTRAADPDLERVETYRDAQSGLQRFFDNLLFFLSLVAIFILILAGIGIQSALTAFLRERNSTVAIVKSVGATNRFVTANFLVVIGILGALGTVLGISGGLVVQRFLPILLARFLPPDLDITISTRVMAESLLLSIIVVGIFTFIPIDRIREMRPSFILRLESAPVPRSLTFYSTLVLLILFFSAMVLWQLNDLMRTLYFVGSTFILIIVSAGVTEAVLVFLHRREVEFLPLRQALRGLSRPRNATRSIIITLAVALAVVFTIYLIEQNLDAAFVSSYPDDAPNAFFIDIQPDQRNGFSETVETLLQSEQEDADFEEPIFYPVVRGSLVAINGEKINREMERQRQGDNLARQFNFTYRNDLLVDEAIAKGDKLFDPAVDGISVSLLDEIFDIREFQIGDKLEVRIQGISLDATVTSIRTRTSTSVSPFFYFVFPPEVLESAPQSIFTALRIPEALMGDVQNRIVAQFPNISVIDVSEAVSAFAATARQLSQIVRFLTLFSILAGLLIIVSSVYATRFARIQEAAYFKVLGAKGSFVFRVFALENMIIGLVSGLVALILAQISSWALSHWVFELTYRPLLGASFLLVLLTILIVMAVGITASISIVRHKPILFLREHSQE